MDRRWLQARRSAKAASLRLASGVLQHDGLSVPVRAGGHKSRPEPPEEAEQNGIQADDGRRFLADA